MKLYTLKEVYDAAYFWYGNCERDSLCLTENRLNKGETWDDSLGHPFNKVLHENAWELFEETKE